MESTDYRLTIKPWQTPLVVLLGGCLISLIGFGARSSYGLYLGPITEEFGWSRENYALAMALQNLFWGLCLPLAGMLADRFGPVWVIGIGALVYAAGTFGVTLIDTTLTLHLTGGVLVGTGVAFTAFSLATAAMLRVVGMERRTFVIGLCTAAGSVGQVLYSPITQGMISGYGWPIALIVTAVSVCDLGVPHSAACVHLAQRSPSEKRKRCALGQQRGDTRGICEPGIFVVDGRLFCLWFSCGFYYRAPSDLCCGSGSCADGGGGCDLADRHIQYFGFVALGRLRPTL